MPYAKGGTGVTSVETSWPPGDSATCAKSDMEKTVTVSHVTNRSIGIRIHFTVSLGMCKNRYVTSGI